MAENYGEIITNSNEAAAWGADQERVARELSQKATSIPLERFFFSEELARFVEELDGKCEDPDDFLRTRIYRYIDPNDNDYYPPELDMVGCINWAIANHHAMPPA
jgi:hypothetical protein